MTNGDHIREMDDSELAYLLSHANERFHQCSTLVIAVWLTMPFDPAPGALVCAECGFDEEGVSMETLRVMGQILRQPICPDCITRMQLEGGVEFFEVI